MNNWLSLKPSANITDYEYKHIIQNVFLKIIIKCISTKTLFTLEFVLNWSNLSTEKSDIRNYIYFLTKEYHITTVIRDYDKKV